MEKKVSSLYIHFPFCKHLCNYCDFYKLKTGDKWDETPTPLLLEYQNYLNESFRIHQKMMERNAVSFAALETLYIGGGTPSLWSKVGADFLKKFLKQNDLQLNHQTEFTIEVNPGGWKEEEIQKWMEAGVNRFSIGLQTLNPDLLPLLDRVHSIEESYKTLEYFSDMKSNFSVDLMLGLPESSKYQRDIKQELQNILTYGPKHLSVYILTVKENYTFGKLIPAEDWIEREYFEVADFLNERGFLQYEVSNFALPGFESRHNLKYWKPESVAALGPSAVGYFHLSNTHALRYKWRPKNKAEEIICEEESLGLKETALEKIYLGLRTYWGVAEESFANLDEFNKFSALALAWEQRGLIERTAQKRWVLNARGMLMMDSLLGEFFGQSK